MDRRSFLKTSSAAAAATATGGAVAAEAGAHAEPAAPAVIAGVQELTLSLPWPDDIAGLGDQAMRLVRRIETATGGRYRIHVKAGADTDGIAAIRSGAADLYHGTEHDHLAHHPAFAWFAGLPCATGLAPHDLEAWLTIDGGQMLWDELAADFGVKALLVGHDGARPGLWSEKSISGLADLAEQKIYVRGLAREVVRGVGAEPAEATAATLAPALASGEIFAAEWGGALQSLAIGLPRVAQHRTGDGINTSGTALSLGMRRSLWEAMSNSDRTIFEACATAELRLSLAEARTHERALCGMLAEAHGVRFEPFPADLAATLSRVAEAVVAHAAGKDSTAQRINASYMTFRAAVAGTEATA